MEIEDLDAALVGAYDGRDGGAALVLSQPAGTTRWDVSVNGGVSWHHLAFGADLTPAHLLGRIDAVLDGCWDAYAWALQDHGMEPPVLMSAVLRSTTADTDGAQPRWDVSMSCTGPDGWVRTECPSSAAGAFIVAAFTDPAAPHDQPDAVEAAAASPSAVQAAADEAAGLLRFCLTPPVAARVNLVAPLLLTRSQPGHWYATAAAEDETCNRRGEMRWGCVPDEHSGHLDSLMHLLQWLKRFEEDDDIYDVMGDSPDGLEHLCSDELEGVLAALDVWAGADGLELWDRALVCDADGDRDSAVEMLWDAFELYDAFEHVECDGNDIETVVLFLLDAAVSANPDYDTTLDEQEICERQAEETLHAAMFGEECSLLVAALTESVEGFGRARTDADLDAAVGDAIAALGSASGPDLSILEDFYETVRPRLAGLLRSHRRDPVDVIVEKLRGCTVRAADLCRVEATAAACDAFVAASNVDRSIDATAAEISTETIELAAEASQAATSLVSGLLNVDAANLGPGNVALDAAKLRLLACLARDDRQAAPRAAAALSAICQMLRTTTTAALWAERLQQQTA